MKVIVAGAGPGSIGLYTGEVIEAVKTADMVLTSSRLTESLGELNNNIKVLGVADTVSYINTNGNKDMTICVIASGDTGFYSIAATIAKGADKSIDIEFLCGIGSLSYFASRIKIGYEAMKLISLHGKEKSIIPYVCYNEKVFTLTGGALKADDIIKELIEAGLSNVTLYIGENLSMEGEKIITGTPEELKEMTFSDLAVMVIHNIDYVNKYRTLKDSDFIRGNTPMTKEAIRNLSLSALEITPSDVVYDIGSGTGSVSCALAMKASESMVYAIEKDNEALKLLKENMNKLGTRNIKVLQGTAPEGLDNLPPADKVFIGGSTGNLKGIIDSILEKNQKATFVVTSVTLETLIEATDIFSQLSFEHEISCVNVSTAKKLGRYNLMKAENPVYIIKGVKLFEE